MAADLDSIEIEIFKHLFASIAEEMGARLMRSAYSPNIKERRDFSCALFDNQAQMIAQAAHIPVHLGSTPMSVQAVVEAFPVASMLPGEQFILNDPFAGGTHLPDITVVAPIFVGDGLPRFFVANRAHHADVGGITPGSMPISKHIDEEGIRLGPTRLDEATVSIICDASRTPEERRGDLLAQRAALYLGEQRLHALCERYGLEIVERRASQLMAYSERIIRSTIGSIPDGVYNFEDWLDGDGFSEADIPIRVQVQIADDAAIVDFSDSGDQVEGPMNAVRAITISAVNYVFQCLTPQEIPSNAGVMRPITVVTRPGSVVDALPPSAVAGGNVETSQRITDALFGAMSEACPDIVPAASGGTMNNLTVGTAAGDPEPFAYYETIGSGSGAGPRGVGGSAIQTHMTNTLNTPVEALEHAYPMVVEAYRIRRSSGGAARHRGGDGIVRRYRFLRDVIVTLLTERRKRGPYGMRGGVEGSPGRNLLILDDGAMTELPGKASLEVSRGQSVEVQTPGGGGWGSRS